MFPAKKVKPLSFRLTLVIAAWSGFSALVYEILWLRLFSFVTATRAFAVGITLSSYLLGLAIGSLVSLRWEKRATRPDDAVAVIARMIVGSNILGFLVAPAVARMVVETSWVATLPLVAVGAASFGVLLPFLCHSAISPDGRAGVKMSYVYLANIIGCGAGSLIAGFLLTDWLTFSQISGGVLAASVGVAALLTVRSGVWRRSDVALWVAATGLVFATPSLFRSFYERLQFKTEFEPHTAFERVLETRHGVITVGKDRAIYGGGVYDGRIDLDPSTGGGLVRPFSVPALHAAPRDILVIGLSGGAWTQILAHLPTARRVVVVEIDHGYLEIIAAYPEVSSLLRNPKVSIAIDDGRRWLRRNPDRRFDVIVMNTTFNWREFASALLGREFLELVRPHLNPGGIMMWNTTGSLRAMKTGMTVFPHTLLIGNMCVGSLAPLEVDFRRWRETLGEFTIDGRPVFDLATPEGRKRRDDFEKLFAAGLLDRAEMQKRCGHASVITDDNLGEEYVFPFAGRGLFRRIPFLQPQP